MTYNINPRKKYRLIIDTETTGGFAKPIVYDIGFSVVDNLGNAFVSRHYVVYEIFVKRPDLMKTAYYAEKIPLYWEKILDEETKIKRFFDIRSEILFLMKLFHIKEVGAFNCAFDKKSLNCTLEFLWGDSQNYFPLDTEFFCIWNMACQTLCMKKSFLSFCKKNAFESERGNGNVQTNAEVIYKYLTNNPDYAEEHMGLQDVMIETQIFTECIRQHKKMNTGINPSCWKLPQEKYREVGVV